MPPVNSDYLELYLIKIKRITVYPMLLCTFIQNLHHDLSSER